ncbi:MAG: hypothetical protein J7493_13335 [Porphyrobacter sp.]|nr:hypothetical protein [Porphyrobacter sp.]
MRRLLLPLALLVPAPALAHDSAKLSSEADQALECAMWAATVAGAIEDPELVTAFGYAMTYWIGRFEGMTGQHFDDFATEEYVNKLQPRFEDLRQRCAPEMEEMGGRMQNWGNRLQAAPSA